MSSYDAPVYHLQSASEASKKAKAKGYEVVKGTKHRILLDLDNDYAVEQYHRVLQVFRHHYSVSRVEEWKSKSGHTHVCITVANEISLSHRLLLQACFGSDGVREFLSLIRKNGGEKEPSVLFKPTPKSRAYEMKERLKGDG